MYILNLVSQRLSEKEVFISTFHVCSGVVDPEVALRDAVAEYLESKDGKEMVDVLSGHFNWGDATMYVPDEYWERHGIQITNTEVCTVTVDRDEKLND